MTSGPSSKRSEPERSSYQESLHSWGVSTFLFVCFLKVARLLIFTPLHIQRSFYLPAFLCRCTSLEKKQDVNSTNRRQKYASSSSQISFIFRQKARTNGSSSIPVSPPRCLGRQRHWNASDRMILRSPHSCWQTRYCRYSNVVSTVPFTVAFFHLVPQKMSFVRMWMVRKRERERKAIYPEWFLWGRWKGKGHFGVISLRLQASFGRRGAVWLACCSSKSGSALTLRTWLATGGGCPQWDGVHSETVLSQW